MSLFASTNFWLWVALIALFALIWWKGRAAIAAGLDAKVEKIREAISEAESLKAEAERTLAEYKRKQRDALAEAERIVAHAQREAEEISKQQMEELKVSLQRREQVAMERIAQAEANAIRAVRAGAVDAAIVATESLLREKLSKAGATRLIDSSIEEVGQRLN
ncbi:MAG: F0F1 ATP synthase subunit B [Rhodospirillales bacterium]